MTDRELLEKAAKAAGLVVRGEAVDSSDIFTHLLVKEGHLAKPRFRWNPLTDDGDALRLMVKLQLDPYTYPNEDDPYAATRRAIVRAAAVLAPPTPDPDA